MARFEPQRVVRSRRLDDEDTLVGAGSASGGWEEYVEYIFPDTAADQPNRRLLAVASKWAARHLGSDDDGLSTSSSSSDSEVGDDGKYDDDNDNGVLDNEDM